jgi:spore coat-associated protein N
MAVVAPLGGRITRGQRLAITVAIVLVALAMVGVGAYATFTGSTSASHSVTTGTVTIALGATGAATNRLTVDATAVAPGDTMQRGFELANTGTLGLASVSLTTSAGPSTALDSDATNGLQMLIDRCSVAWTEAGSSPAFTYSCSGTTITVVASRPIIGSNLAMPGLSALTSGGTDHLRLTLTLPSATGNAFQGLTSTITYTFTGTQRAATDR